jgi:nitric-oxide synthase, bacterial
VAAECVTHLQETINGGRIRPLITVFAPDAPGLPGPRIWNSQLIRYAGYPRHDGTVTGDPINTRITELAHRLGWAGPGGRFDVLPLIIQAAGEGPQMFAIPPDAVLEVPLTHPSYPWFADLGLRWHAVPVISDMFLTAGGIRYPCAPFNGWYMGTEVGSRNLGDTGRYNKCPTVARHMGLNMSTERSLWRDRALVELNTAVLHSFDQAGVTVTDHHTESERFLTHLRREERAGRMCPADWSWIVPPLAGSACGVFHRYYDNTDLRPGFYRHLPTPTPYMQSEDP